VWADGYRPEDGAAVEAKNVRDPDCTKRTLTALNESTGREWETGTHTGDASELSRYASAAANPANHVRYVEIDTNYEESVDYWKLMAAEQGLTANVRYVP
jgi:hypothetical protein